MRIKFCLSILVCLSSSCSGLTSKTTSPPSSNKTNLLSRRSIPANSTGMPDVLVVTTTMRMLYRIHSNTTNLGPAVPLDTVFVICISCLQHWLLSPASACNLTDHSTTPTWHNLLGSRWKLNPGSPVIRIVTDDNGVIARASREHTAVTDVVLHVTDDGSFGDGLQRQHIPDHQIRLLPAVHELAGVHPFGGHEQLLLVLVPERVAERDTGKRGAPTRIVYDIGDHALEVAIALAEVEGAEAGRALAVVGVGLEDGARTLTLRSDDPTHFGG